MNNSSKKRIIIPIIVAIAALLIGAVAGYQYKEYEISKKLDEAFSTNNTKNTDTSNDTADSTDSTNETTIGNTKLSEIMDATKGNFSTVTETKVFNEENDPNGTLGKAGSYSHGAAFWDSRTEYTSEDSTWGTDAGGAIEVFANEEDATSRTETLQGTQGTILDAGAVEQVGNVVLRASSKLPASQQNEIIAFLKSQL
ncbi:hypothetical protein RAAC3_TM7C00001G0439 [Candidatus Saccharibacteria bacterium RAAC3_TM7_1]|nr:hypothetical protein RAAC3_TM7C00001G0439 [Candidatus Saccharibacteria bacterium RAAC3_TM7_1]